MEDQVWMKFDVFMLEYVKFSVTYNQERDHKKAQFYLVLLSSFVNIPALDKTSIRR